MGSLMPCEPASSRPLKPMFLGWLDQGDSCDKRSASAFTWPEYSTERRIGSTQPVPFGSRNFSSTASRSWPLRAIAAAGYEGPRRSRNQFRETEPIFNEVAADHNYRNFQSNPDGTAGQISGWRRLTMRSTFSHQLFSSWIPSSSRLSTPPRRPHVLRLRRKTPRRWAVLPTWSEVGLPCACNIAGRKDVCLAERGGHQ